MLNEVYVNLKKQSNFDKVIYLIIFLLPIFAISVRTWVSGIFVLLFLLSIGYLFFDKLNKRHLEKEEKYYIYILVFYFCVFLLASLAHGWSEPQTHILGTMLHFVAIIPIFLMFRNLKLIIPVIITGSIVACIVNIFYLYDNPVKGVYGYLFSGPIMFLSCAFVLPLLSNNKINTIVKILLLILIMLNIITIFELGARSTFVALLFVTILYAFVYTKGRNRLIAIMVILLSGIGSYYGNDKVHTRIDRIYTGISVYLNEKNPAEAKVKFDTIHDISARFEMWRASKYFVAKNPILGFGPDEFKNEINILIEKKLINAVANASHPHNAFLHELYAKGILGLLAMLLVFYYPCYIFIVRFKINSEQAILGFSVILSLTAFSLTESAAFNNNNFSSIMLIYITIILGSFFQNKIQSEELH